MHGQVLAQWPQMFRILDMFRTCRFCVSVRVVNSLVRCLCAVAAREASATTTDGAEVDADADMPAGGRLVRVPIDELQQIERK